MQGLLSNAMVSKLLLKYMQGKAGLRTKMVLPRSGMKVQISNRVCLPHAATCPSHGKSQLPGPQYASFCILLDLRQCQDLGGQFAAFSCTSNWAVPVKFCTQVAALKNIVMHDELLSRVSLI